MLESSDGFFTKKPDLDTRIESCKGGRKSSGGASGSSTNSRKKGSIGDGTSDVVQSITSSTSSSSIVQVGTLSQFLDQ